MTPATIKPSDLPIYKGARWSHTFTFLQAGTDAPVDLTDLGPFALTFKREAGDTLLVHGSVTIDDAEAGKLAVLLTGAQTDALPLGKVRIGLRDRLNNPYAQGFCDVLFFAPDPA
jgi:hypothetical protein